MNAGAKANQEKAAQIGSRIAQWRSEGLTYSDIGKLVQPNISASAAKQRLWRHNQRIKEENNGYIHNEDT